MYLNNILKARLYLPENTSCALLRQIIDVFQESVMYEQRCSRCCVFKYIYWYCVF